MATVRRDLSGFLVRLGDEPDLFEEYMKNRESVMEREGVTPADRAAILCGDLREIRARLKNEYSEPEEPPTIMKPDEEPPTIMEPEEPPTIMEPEEPPTIMEPEEPKPHPESEPEAD
jgi:hypothetical protein